MFKNQIGKFYINNNIIEEKPEHVMKVLGSVIIIGATQLMAHKAIEYVAMGPQFTMLVQGQLIPQYNVILTGENEVQFTKVDSVEKINSN